MGIVPTTIYKFCSTDQVLTWVVSHCSIPLDPLASLPDASQRPASQGRTSDVHKILARSQPLHYAQRMPLSQEARNQMVAFQRSKTLISTKVLSHHLTIRYRTL